MLQCTWNSWKRKPGLVTPEVWLTVLITWIDSSLAKLKDNKFYRWFIWRTMQICVHDQVAMVIWSWTFNFAKRDPRVEPDGYDWATFTVTTIDDDRFCCAEMTEESQQSWSASGLFSFWFTSLLTNQRVQLRRVFVWTDRLANARDYHGHPRGHLKICPSLEHILNVKELLCLAPIAFIWQLLQND